MKKTIAYMRVSTDKQDAASQRSSIEKWAQEKKLRCEFVQDLGLSGSSSNRPGFQEVLKRARAGEIEQIIVYKLDRLSRCSSTAIRTILELDDLGVSFVSVTQPVLNFSNDNPFRKTMLAAFSEIAEIERQTIVDRVKAGLKAAKERGVTLGAPKKFNEADQREIKRLRSLGKSLRQISKITRIPLTTVSRLSRQV